MELTVIGCWAAYPATAEACSGYLVRNNDTCLLLDCGHSVFSYLRKYEDYENLDAVFISHFHPDHYVDLYALRHAIRAALYLGRRDKPLKVYMPGEPTDMFEYWSALPEFEVIKTAQGSRAVLQDISMTFYPTLHPVSGLAVKVEAGNSSLFYTGDTSYNNELVAAAEKVDLLLAESTMSANEQEYALSRGHMTSKDVGEWARISSPGLLVATHFWDGYERDTIKQELVTHCKNKFIMARSGLSLTI